MSALVDLFTAPARAKALLLSFLAVAVLCLALTRWALIERVSAVQARAERDRALDQVAVVSAAAKACSSSVDQAKRVGDATVKATDALLAAAQRLNAPAVHTIERIEKTLERPAPPGAGCDQAHDELEADYRKRKAGAPQ